MAKRNFSRINDADRASRSLDEESTDTLIAWAVGKNALSEEHRGRIKQLLLREDLYKPTREFLTWILARLDEGQSLGNAQLERYGRISEQFFLADLLFEPSEQDIKTSKPCKYCGASCFWRRFRYRNVSLNLDGERRGKKHECSAAPKKPKVYTAPRALPDWMKDPSLLPKKPPGR